MCYFGGSYSMVTASHIQSFPLRAFFKLPAAHAHSKKPVVLPLLSSPWEWPRHPEGILVYSLTFSPMCINGPIFNTFCDTGLFILCICGNK